MTNVVSTSAGSAGLSAMRRGQVHIRNEAVRSDRREQALDRVDRLVPGMEAVAQTLSSDQISSTQRSVLVSRFNDLQRRVNRIDGVVGSEGRGDAVGQGGVRPDLGVETPEAAEQTFRQVRQVRRQIQAERRPAPEPVRASEPVQTPEPVRPTQEADTAQGRGKLIDLEA